MRRLKLLTATALVAGLVAAPALSPALAEQPASKHVTMHHHYRADRDHRDSGFWPTDVAAGAVGTAIGTAGAIATAPFRGDSYAYYDNPNYNGYGYWPNNETYAQRNGFVCTPGTWFRGEDGRRHICQ